MNSLKNNINQNKNFFYSKADTLLNLNLKNAKIPILKKFILKLIFKTRIKFNSISSKFKNKFIIIRSSFSNEDTQKTSNAGKYESYLNILSSDHKTINLKIDQLSKLKKHLEVNIFLYKKW